MNPKQELMKPAPLRRRATIKKSTPLWMLLGTALLTTSCVTRTVVRQIPSDRYVVTVEAGATFTAPCRGKFVPDARFLQLMDAYIRESNTK